MLPYTWGKADDCPVLRNNCNSKACSCILGRHCIHSPPAARISPVMHAAAASSPPQSKYYSCYTHCFAKVAHDGLIGMRRPPLACLACSAASTEDERLRKHAQAQHDSSMLHCSKVQSICTARADDADETSLVYDRKRTTDDCARLLCKCPAPTMHSADVPRTAAPACRHCRSTPPSACKCDCYGVCCLTANVKAAAHLGGHTGRASSCVDLQRKQCRQRKQPWHHVS